MQQDIRTNLERVRERIARAAERAGRRAEDVLLVGVSKTVEVARARAARAAGLTALGENRVQEARGKVAELGRPVAWHLVGHLQTNKVRDALELFDVVHSVDRIDLARELDRRARARGCPVDALVQVNVGLEPSKGGWPPEAVETAVEALTKLGGLRLRGLMAIPPAVERAEDARGWFRSLRQLADQYGLRAVASNASLVSAADVVILAVKPQIMAPVLREAMPALTNRPLLISIAAGVSTATIQSILGKYPRLIRVMPNTPALVLQGVTAIARAPGLEQDDLETAQEIFAAVGRAVVLDEEQMDAVTGLSGSGPAYVALVIEALADGGVKMGLDRATATTLATQTVLGAAKLLAETGLHPGALKDMVSSPGGTPISGIAALEEGGVRTTFIRAVERATQRSRELGMLR